MTAALEGGEWSAARPGRALPQGKIQYPLYRMLGGPQGQSGQAENLAPPGFDPWTIQPVVSRYTDSATQPTIVYNNIIKSVLYLSMLWCWDDRLKCINHQRGSHFVCLGPQWTCQMCNEMRIKFTLPLHLNVLLKTHINQTSHMYHDHYKYHHLCFYPWKIFYYKASDHDVRPSLYSVTSRQTVVTTSKSAQAVCHLPLILEARVQSQGSSCRIFGRQRGNGAWFSNVHIFPLSGPVTHPSLTLFNHLNTKRRPLYLKTQSVLRCKHFSSRL